ncbi:MAG: transposase, family [Thermoanaerobacteraceae bacterium]|jgi:IS5 family transposase|nr:transposase, family [Thermoanaerobacteraceae bacterium]
MEKRESYLLNRWKAEAIERMTELFNKGTSETEKLKGKSRANVEFGRKIVLTESEESLIICNQVEEGNPADKILLVPTVRKSIKVPKKVATDRGFYSSKNEREIQDLKVKHVAIPKPGKKSEKRVKHERQHWFKRLI